MQTYSPSESCEKVVAGVCRRVLETDRVDEVRPGAKKIEEWAENPSSMNPMFLGPMIAAAFGPEVYQAFTTESRAACATAAMKMGSDKVARRFGLKSSRVRKMARYESVRVPAIYGVELILEHANEGTALAALASLAYASEDCARDVEIGNEGDVGVAHGFSWLGALSAQELAAVQARLLGVYGERVNELRVRLAEVREQIETLQREEEALSMMVAYSRDGER